MKPEDETPAVAPPFERGVGRLVNEGTEVECKHPNKVEQHFTHGYRWHCPDCKARDESWWD